jgi:adenosine deaminase
MVGRQLAEACCGHAGAGLCVTVPLVELHCHLEGAVPPALALTKAGEHGIWINDLITPDGESYVWSDFVSFLAAYDRIADLFRTPRDYRDLTYAHYTSLAAQGAIYGEVFLSPDHMCGSAGYAETLDAAVEGYLAARGETGIEGRFIPLAVRNRGSDHAVEVARLTARHARPTVTGFGLAGDERAYVPADFAPAFAIAAEAGLACTAHAGELAGPESIRQALDDLPVTRVGHGVRAIEDADLVRRLADERIVLEVCPGSNIALGLYDGIEAHPLKRLMEAGVRVTLNSDDPPFFRTSLANEYALCGRSLGLSDGDLTEIGRTAIGAAFVDEDTRTRLLHKLG